MFGSANTQKMITLVRNLEKIAKYQIKVIPNNTGHLLTICTKPTR